MSNGYNRRLKVCARFMQGFFIFIRSFINYLLILQNRVQTVTIKNI